MATISWPIGGHYRQVLANVGQKEHDMKLTRSCVSSRYAAVILLQLLQSKAIVCLLPLKYDSSQVCHSKCHFFFSSGPVRGEFLVTYGSKLLSVAEFFKGQLKTCIVYSQKDTVPLFSPLPPSPSLPLSPLSPFPPLLLPLQTTPVLQCLIYTTGSILSAASLQMVLHPSLHSWPPYKSMQNVVSGPQPLFALLSLSLSVTRSTILVTLYFQLTF